ncbi:MAG: glycosyltransferase family 39 protein [bacterium]|nr:glycosyltransferase family 39 protein [bacterium]
MGNTTVPTSHPSLLSENAVLIYLALCKLLIHVSVNLSGGYGYFRDEFYYIACTEHLALGYVDQPPLSIFFLWLSRGILGDSLLALRFLPALAGALMVFLSGLIARELGGKLFAQVLTALAVIAAPIYLAMQNFFSMNAFDQLLWVMGAYIIVRLVKTEEPKWWLLLGLVMGFGLLNKISMLWFGFGLFVGLVLTPLRKSFLSKWPWITGAISFTIFLPHIFWQLVNDWPTLEFMGRAASEKMLIKSPLEFFFGQLEIMTPLTFPFWFIGLCAYFFSKKNREFRILGWLYVAVFLLLLLNKTSRAAYLAPTYPMLFAAGAVTIEGFSQRKYWGWLKPVSAIVLIVTACASAPFALPILPVDTFIRYSQALGMTPSDEERHEKGLLPQFYADMHGWEAMVAAVAEVYHSLSPEEQAQCVVFTGNYGEAGAIDFLGKNDDLPRAISGHNNYWLWGPGENIAEVMIVLGRQGTLERSYEQLERAGLSTCTYCMPYENNLPIYIARGLRVPVQDFWSQVKHYE